MMLSVVTMRWGRLFTAAHVNALFRGVRRHYARPFRPICVTDDPAGIEPWIEIQPLPTEFADTPRCCRRLWLYSRDRRQDFGPRVLHLDLDTVLTGDLTPLLTRPEPLVALRMEYASVYSPAMLLFTTGILDGFYRAFAADPEGCRQATGVPHASDLALLNHYLAGRHVPTWDWDDGVVVYFGQRYFRWVRYGIGPADQVLPEGTRVVILGSADLPHLNADPPAWWREHAG